MSEPATPGELVIRPAAEDDLPALLGLIRELAAYEHLEDEVIATEADFRNSLHGDKPAAEALMVELDNAPIGYAIFFHTFSTFIGKPGLYLEDIYIRPDHRRKGHGQQVLKRLARIAIDRGCRRFEWSALDWNEPAINAYLKIGAVPLNDWTVFRMNEAAMMKLVEN